jgi:(R,R)-butanediol dehydrogenase/meso-butanediol dehydrogenase/diacetyl reductase
MAHALKEMSGIVFGHEFCGTVVAVGADVVGYHDGDQVVGFPLSGCRQCPECQSGWTSKCRRARLIGAQRSGAYAEYVAVGAAESFLLPEGLSSESGALVEPLAVAHHALDSTPLEPDEPILVLGAGPVGLAIALWAQALGTGQVIVSDPAEHRRALAARLGATVIDPAEQNVGAAFADVTGRRPRVVLECVGLPGILQQVVELTARDAHITMVGACTQPETFAPIIATTKELTLRFVVYYQRSDFATSLDAMVAGTLDPQVLVTSRVGLEELPQKFAGLMAPSPDCKVLIHPWG